MPNINHKKSHLYGVAFRPTGLSTGGLNSVYGSNHTQEQK